MKPWLKHSLALVAACAAAVFAYMWTLQYEDQLKSARFLKLKSNVQLIAGETVLTNAMIEVAELPARFTDGLKAVAIPESPASYRSGIVGKVASRDVAAGSILLLQDFAPEEELDLAAQIKPGFRALTVPVGAQGTVGYFVRPGSRVDLIGSLVDPSGPENAAGQMNIVTTVLLSDVNVLAVGSARNYSEYQRIGGNGYSTVTLELTPGDANLLTFAQQQLASPLSLVLRPQQGESEKAAVPSVGWTLFRERTGG